MTDLATMLVEDAVKDEKMETAKNALKEGLSVETIKKITGLDKMTIERLQTEIENE